jgi:putative ABC transport system permease protein
MNLRELLKMALINIKGSKMRSLLTTLGIMIGIAAVIAVVAIGEGGRSALNMEVEKFGTNIFVIYVREELRPGDFQMIDVEVIKSAVPQVKYLAPQNNLSVKVRGPRKEINLGLTGTTSELADIRNIEMKSGRFINEDDQVNSRNVIVLEEDAARELFGTADPLGQQVSIEGDGALVVGVVRKVESKLDEGGSKAAYVPLSFTSHMRGIEMIYYLYGSATDKTAVDEAMNSSVKVLERRHQNPKHYSCESMQGNLRQINQILDIIGLIISSIAGISLLVGGIGVMNIMLVSVSDRTREIGIRMALGARRRDILIQFLVEAIVLCLIGGLLGTIIGYSGAFAVAKIADWPPLVSWKTIGLAFGFSTAVGLIFGVYPANRAARLDPIEALRRD